MLGSPILYLKGMRILMFQLSGFYYMSTTNTPFPGDFLETDISYARHSASRVLAAILEENEGLFL